MHETLTCSPSDLDAMTHAWKATDRIKIINPLTGLNTQVSADSNEKLKM